MFKFHKLALQNAKPQNAKILLFTIVSFIILFALTVLTFIPVQPAIYKFLMSMAMQQPIGSSLITLILAILIPLVVFIFAGYQLIAGTIYTIDNAINKDKVKFKDLFSIFKKGKYAKSLKLSLITLLSIIIILLLNLLISKLLQLGIVQLFTALQGPLSSSDHALGLSLTFQIIAATLQVFILSFVYWFFTILIINFTLAFVKEPNRGAWSSVKRGFKAIKNGNKTWFKFYLGILLLNLPVIILANPVSQLVSISTGGISQTLAMTIIYIVSVIVIIIRLIVYYTNLLAIIQYYNKNGENIDKSEVKKSKASKQSDQTSKVTNSVNHTTEKATDEVNHTTEKSTDKVNQNTDQFTDNTKEKTTDIKDQMNNKNK
ncbi:hypothetical protein [Staphylococcus cohnii]|uniref:hypothetical protein n=1 Tax=Staphylococcus cohnii TaxID=29382 RepID=UPI000D1BC340|nr:hypothetical protein [Staphylococcus cohnii]PTF05538.1 hypothetical protein BUY36_08650 [Staphylococcus cohnii]PTG66335.1 hypothetical protein BUY28_08970 [Staphylococcus cohnii]